MIYFVRYLGCRSLLRDPWLAVATPVLVLVFVTPVLVLAIVPRVFVFSSVWHTSLLALASSVLTLPFGCRAANRVVPSPCSFCPLPPLISPLPSLIFSLHSLIPFSRSHVSSAPSDPSPPSQLSLKDLSCAQMERRQNDVVRGGDGLGEHCSANGLSAMQMCGTHPCISH